MRTLYGAALTDPIPDRWLTLMREMQRATGPTSLDDDTAASISQAGE